MDARYVNEGQANSVNSSMIANDDVGRADLAGNEVVLYRTLLSCENPRQFTLTATCLTRECGAGLHFQCADEAGFHCSSAAPQICLNVAVGYLLDPNR